MYEIAVLRGGYLSQRQSVFLIKFDPDFVVTSGMFISRMYINKQDVIRPPHVDPYHVCYCSCSHC